MTINFPRTALLCWMAALLAACAELPLQAPPGADAERAWQTRRETLSALQDWSLAGRIAIQAEQESWNAALRWTQQGVDYDISLSSPLGQNVAQLHGDALGVVLRTADGELSAQDGESLLYQSLGWRVPVAGLRYWVLGLPDPSASMAEEDYELDAAGRLARLHQSGWDIEMRRYTDINGVELPDKLFLSRSTPDGLVDIRLVVEQWQIKQ